MSPGYRYLLQLILMLIASWLCAPSALHAQSVSCANPTINNIQFGTIDLTTGTVNVTGSVSWSCTSTGILGILLSPQVNIAMCLNLNTGTGGTQANPRLLSNGTNTLQYQLYLDAATTQVWGSTATPGTPIPLSIAVSIPAGLLFSTTVTGQTPFYARLPGSQTSAPVGTYNSTLAATVTGSYNLNTNTPLSSCTSGQNALNAGSAAFTASATIQKACTVTANNVSLGTVPFTAVNTTASNTLGVSCTNGTPYFVGLAPSSGNATGAGTMKGAASGNTDKVPYQLTSTPGPSGVVWGNTATATSAGNGVAGTGSGLTQALTVYATAASANYTPDSYSDTVTINVNY